MVKLQICELCETKYCDKAWIDICLICRGHNIIRVLEDDNEGDNDNSI